MKKTGFVMNMIKPSYFWIMLVMLTSCLVLMGCSDVMDRPANEIPPDLRNTAWTRQISDSETVTISFGRNIMTMSSNKVSSQYNQQWEYRGGYCCGYGYCGFYNGSSSLDFRYTGNNNGITITGSNMQSLNGNWTRK